MASVTPSMQLPERRLITGTIKQLLGDLGRARRRSTVRSFPCAVGRSVNVATADRHGPTGARARAGGLRYSVPGRVGRPQVMRVTLC